MIIQLKRRASQADIQKTVARLKQLAFETGANIRYQTVQGEELPVIAVKASGADTARNDLDNLTVLKTLKESLIHINWHRDRTWIEELLESNACHHGLPRQCGLRVHHSC